MAKNKRPTKKNPRLLAAVAVACALFLGLLLLNPPADEAAPKNIPLSQALKEIRDGKVAKAEVSDSTNKVVLTLSKDAGGKKVEANYPFAYSDTLTEELIKAKVTTKAVAPPKPNPLVNLFMSLLPILLLVGLLIWLTKSGALTGGIGKMSGKRGKQLGEVPKDRFADVAGADEALGDMVELVDFLKDGSKFTAAPAVNLGPRLVRAIWREVPTSQAVT